MESGVVLDRRQAYSLLPDEELESVVVPGQPLAPPPVFADESEPEPAWIPRLARVPGLSLASYTELR